MKVVLKGLSASIQSTQSVQLSAPIVAQTAPVVSQPSQLGVSAPSVIGGNDKVFLVDAFVKPNRMVKPFELAPCD